MALIAVVLLGVLAGVAYRTEIKALVDEGVLRLRDAGPVVFFLGMALLPALGFPLISFTFAAGPVFGPTMGVGNVIACAILAVMLNVVLTYWLAARALRPLVARLAGLLGYRLPVNTAGTAWQITAIVRITPGLPFFMQSYLLGLMRMPFVPYLVMSTLMPAAYLTAIILGGDALWQGRIQLLLVAAGLLGFIGAVVHLLRKRQAGKVKKEGIAESKPLEQAGTHDGLN